MGWLMGPGSSGFNWGKDWDGWAGGWTRALGLVPPVWVGQCWEPLQGDTCKDSSGMGPGASSHSSAEPSAKKRVRPGTYVRSPFRSPSTSNLTCFFGFSAGGRHHFATPCS